MRRLVSVLAAVVATLVFAAGPAFACGGLIGPNGAVNLLRTTTLAGYHNGVEHYVTAFEYAGGGGAFGSLIPLPGVPSDVVKGGDWTLQRLIKETTPPVPAAFRAASAAPSAEAQVLMTRKIDALDITVLKGGADEVGTWAKNHGFRLPPDAPEVLDFYATRSPIFLAAAFDPTRAAERGQSIGDGTPVHITIPTPNPWVPLRILSLGKAPEDRVQADVFLLTDRKPAILPQSARGIFAVTHDDAASESLLSDLRSDRGMDWIPSSAWLTKISIDSAPTALRFDLAIDASGQGTPSRVAAGFDPPTPPSLPRPTDILGLIAGFAIIILGMSLIVALMARRPASGQFAS